MSRFLLSLRCFFAVLFYYRLPREAARLLPAKDLTPLPAPEPVATSAAKTQPALGEEEAPIAAEKPAAPAADGLQNRSTTSATPTDSEVRPPPTAAPLEAAAADDLRRRGAVQMLSLLQREGRLIDFLMEEVDGYGDAQIGAAARDIHRGCRKGLLEHLKVAPVRQEPDEAAVRIEDGYDPSAVRLIGNITGRPPFHGTLRHHGWRAREVLLPELPASHDPLIITPAEVELGG